MKHSYMTIHDFNKINVRTFCRPPCLYLNVPRDVIERVQKLANKYKELERPGLFKRIGFETGVAFGLVHAIITNHFEFIHVLGEDLDDFMDNFPNLED